MSARGTGRALAAVAACVAATVAAVGWLYLLRDVRGLAAGPRVRGALPLERLARHEAQPLLRVLAAWVPAALAAGVVLAWVTRLGGAGRAAVAAGTAFAVLFATGVASDAITASNPPGLYVASQLQHPALWLGTVVMAAGAALAAPWLVGGRGP
ncbi:MAG TPA: hypothetical protein VLB47_09310 [Solirubrobacteraceae bacterium]|nr:hypothetical protein [Solirubrobacteraceae bacterium]